MPWPLNCKLFYTPILPSVSPSDSLLLASRHILGSLTEEAVKIDRYLLTMHLHLVDQLTSESLRFR